MFLGYLRTPKHKNILLIISAISSFLWGRWGQQCADFGFGELAALHTVADPDKGAGDNEVITFGELDVRCIQYAAFALFKHSKNAQNDPSFAPYSSLKTRNLNFFI
jgi:hypothetical protein